MILESVLFIISLLLIVGYCRVINGFFPDKQDVKEYGEDEVFYAINFNFARLILFGFTFIVMIFSYSIIRIIQYLIFSNAKFAFVEIPLMILIPIGIFSLTISGFINLKLFSLEFFEKKLGEKLGAQVYYGLWSISKHGLFKRKKLWKKLLVVLIIISISLLTVVLLCANDYVLVEDDGIYYNSVFSIVSTHFGWDDISFVLKEYGRILKDNESSQFYETPAYIILTKDKTRIDLSDMVEIDDNKIESINFILDKTGLEIKNAFWNTATDEYFEYSNATD